MNIIIKLENYAGEVTSEWAVTTDSPGRALQMYQDEVGEFDSLRWEFAEDQDLNKGGIWPVVGGNSK
jgi:hypothetical protein